MDKLCSKCGETKPRSAFSRNRTTRDGYQKVCKGCKATYLRSHYERNKKKYKEAAQKAKRERAELLRTIKHMKPCVDCGNSYPHYVMDFDHRVPSKKDMNVSRLVVFSTPRMLKEIEKCDLVCANCHRERTFGPIA